RAYLVTLSHTDKEEGADGQKLVPPGTYTRMEVRDFFLGALLSTQANRDQPLAFTSMAVFQERHATGQIHYHVALSADKCFRFAPLKRHLLAAHGLASHWSGKTDGYAGCIAYCYLPSPTKAVEELDPTPELWPSNHPPLSEASRGSVSAQKLEAHREDQRRKRAGKGKAEQRVREVDLWPIIVRENILPDEVCAEKLMAYAKRSGGQALVEFCFANWDKLPGIVAKSWKTEKVEDLVAAASQSRLEILEGACSAPCTCTGQWACFADAILSQTDNVFVTPPKSASFVIARPQNLYSGHLRYVKDDPLFITTLQSDLHALKGKLKQGDLDMMVKRLKLFEFKQKVTLPSHVAKGCGSCFAHFILGPGLQTRVLRSEAAKRGATPSGETPEPKRMMCLSWTVDDVCTYIADLELGHVVAAFRDNAVDGRMLASLSETDL
ncbi:SAM domain-containing protein (Fragment), partial [Durusdinium trenchii]